MRGMYGSRRFRAECMELIVGRVIDGCLDSVFGCSVVYRAEWSYGRCLKVDYILPLMGGEEGSGMGIATDYEGGV